MIDMFFKNPMRAQSQENLGSRPLNLQWAWDSAPMEGVGPNRPTDVLPGRLLRMISFIVLTSPLKLY